MNLADHLATVLLEEGIDAMLRRAHVLHVTPVVDRDGSVLDVLPTKETGR